MKAQILKIAGVKSEKEFYKKYPSEEAFMKKHSKEFKKAQMGAAVNSGSSGFKPISYSDQFDQADKMITGSTATERQAALAKQQAAAPQGGGGGGFDVSGLMKLAGSVMGGEGMEGMGDTGGAGAAAARHGIDIRKAQNGLSDWYSNNPVAGSTDYGQQAQPSIGLQREPISSVSNLKPAGVTYSSMPTAPTTMGPVGAKDNTWSKVGGALGKYAGPVGDVISGIGELQKEKEARKAAEQARDVSKVSLKAAESIDVDARRQQSENIAKQREAQMPVNTGEEFFPIYGVGTNVLARNGLRLQGGGEIQNTFAPNDIYMDSGYEPLNDSNIKQYYHGGRLHQMQDGGAAAGGGTPWGMISQKATGIGQELMGGQNAGGKIGSTVGSTLGMIGGPIGSAIGGFVGGIAGNALDTNAKRMKKAQDATQRNMQGMASANMAKGIQAQNQSYMKDGGWVSHDWTPQVIASFGEHKLSDLLQPPNDADMLRAGGHLRDYTPPSDRAMEIYEDGGEVNNYRLGGVEVESGGYLEPISYNPYNDGTGITSMIKGQSHEDYDSKLGHSGVILNAYGNQVEAEKGEPIREVEEGGIVGNDESAVITGNLVYKNLNNMFDPKYNKYQDKKIKNIHKEIALKDQKLNKLEEKNTNELVEFDPKTSIDKLKLASLQAKELGYKMQYKDNAKDANYFTDHQSIINDTAEEHGLVADDLARGKAKVDKEAMKKQAKFGGKFTQAQDGKEVNDKEIVNQISDEELDKIFNTPSNNTLNTTLDEVIVTPNKKRWQVEQIEEPEEPDYMTYNESDVPSNKKSLTKSGKNKDWWKEASSFANAALPYFRPSDAEDLDTAQLYPEMFAMATNQVSPVQAQTYQPDLSTPYDVSFQDQLNANQADYRAAQRMAGYNPAAQANLNAQKYQANQSVLANQFRANQEMKNKAYAENRNMLNQAKLQNLGIFDKQYERQTEALANTKAKTQAALNSISDKYAKNKLEGKTLKTYENMYNYRFGPNFRTQNMNPLAQFDTDYKGASAEELEAMSVLKKAQDKKEAAAAKKDAKETDKKRNGSIVKSYKNI